jgi:hypothetical protein
MKPMSGILSLGDDLNLDGSVGAVAESPAGNDHWPGHTIEMNLISNAREERSVIPLNIVEVACGRNAVCLKDRNPNLHKSLLFPDLLMSEQNYPLLHTATGE